MSSDQNRSEGQPGAVQAALFGLCPRCGGKTLFAGLADFSGSCSQCGLDFKRFNVGDGPAAFLTMIIGAVILALAMWLEFSLYPPFWVHAILWIPLTGGAVLLGLRASKAALLQAEYWRDAREAGSGDTAADDSAHGGEEPR